jgi:GTP-binding protein
VSASSELRFLDEVSVTASSGKGGDGKVAWRREKYVPRGGPAGGDGGRGGDVVFVATSHRNTLYHLRFSPNVKARDGAAGGTSNKSGAAGSDAVVEVPPGTVVRDAASGDVLADLVEPGTRWVALPGGQGGRGNSRFTTSTRQAPEFAEAGQPGQDRRFLLELKLLADIGLLGFPNAGKSTLISRVSAVRPKIAPYPFTTLVPSLGVVHVPGTERTFVMADVPGLIEGASHGAGLGLRFLRHVERCRLLLHLVSLDPVDAEGHGDVRERVARIDHELACYDARLSGRPQVLVLTKSDLSSPESLAQARAALSPLGRPLHVVSAVQGAGIEALLFAALSALDALPAPGALAPAREPASP